MIRSGNPELDLAIDRIIERVVLKFKVRDPKHGEKSITAHGNMPQNTGSFKEIIDHLNSEIRELKVELGNYSDANKVKNELIDVIAMCVLTHWYIDELVKLDEYGNVMDTLRPDPIQLSEITESTSSTNCFMCGRETDGTQQVGDKVVCMDPPCMDMALKGIGGATPCISCTERRECYMYHCNVCGDQEQFEEYAGESTKCGFCRGGDLIYSGLTCRLYDLAMEDSKAKNPTRVPGRELYRAFDKSNKTPEDVN